MSSLNFIKFLRNGTDIDFNQIIKTFKRIHN